MTIPTERIQELAAGLVGQIEGDLKLDPLSRAVYATDASMYEVVPVGVLIPKTADDIVAAVSVASGLGIPILPRGGGSSLAGQAVNEALVIDCTPHMHRVLGQSDEAGWACVQPGITLAALNKHLRPSGWMVGPDPASGARATLGGMLGNNSTGTHSILYGNMKSHVRSARVVLADGSEAFLAQQDAETWRQHVRKRGLEGRIYEALDALALNERETILNETPGHWRRASGYRLEELLEESPNLARLLCGSEGTLAVVTKLTVDLVRRPAFTAVGVVHFETRRQALQSVTEILETNPAAVELLDGSAIERCLSLPEYARKMTFVQGKPGAVLLTEYYGESQTAVSADLERLGRRLSGRIIVRLEEPNEIASAWSVRSEALGLIMGVKGNHKPVAFIEDASVPVEHLADYIDDLNKLLSESDTRSVMYAHASAGCLHVRPFINTKDARDVAKMRELAQGSADLVRSYGGWVSSEHGDGLVRSWLNPEFLGPALYGACKEVKTIFDADGILNPGRVVDAPPMTSNLRTGPDYQPLPGAAKMLFEQTGSYAAEVEQCNGNGACRKLGTGTMCPSFMATRQEVDSTRGRANVLRMAMNGRVPDLGDADVYEALSLCLQCKACKRECPSAVDMAKLKTDWLDGYWQRNGTPLKTRLFANIPKVARLVSGPLAPLANRMSGGILGRAGLRALGLSGGRAAPTFARKAFCRKGGSAADIVDADNSVVLFVDTFSNFQHPEVPRAATEVLEAAGYQVIPVGNVCCGRTQLSKGFVTAAQREAMATVQRLHPFVDAGLPVIGLEPSCILTLGDEFPSLIPGDPRTINLGVASVEFETFVSQNAERFRRLDWRASPADVHVHGHCHQKALGTFEAAPSCYGVTGSCVKVIDAGCCGMAGSFGYEHEEVSRLIGEERLAPAVRSAPPEAHIAAAGASCRAQINDLTSREALHPAQILRAALRL